MHHQKLSQCRSSPFQDPFEIEGQNLKVPLSKEQEDELKDFCLSKLMTVDKLELLLLQLFECIVLRLIQPRDVEDVQDAADFV